MILLNQMSILLILLVVSAFGIIFMISKKLSLIRNGQIREIEGALFEIQNLEKLKHTITKNLRKYGHVGLVITLRFYVRSVKFLSSQYSKIKEKIKNMTKNKERDSRAEVFKANGFLKRILDYKNKIKVLKDRIKEEEKSL